VQRFHKLIGSWLFAAVAVSCGDDGATAEGDSGTSGESTDAEGGNTTLTTSANTTTPDPDSTSEATTVVDESSTGDETTGTETTDTTDTTDTTGTETTGGAAVCGDGVMDVGEECDDGENNGPGQACLDTCVLNACGDGDVGPREACDDGNEIDDDGCTNACALPTCGDGIVQDGEACDDGNAVETDTCLSTCILAQCGDGVVQDGVEACDDGNQTNEDACTNACLAAACGDGFLQPGEECDDGNQDDTDGCTNACIEVLGNTCGGAILVDAVPYQDSGTTVGTGNEYSYAAGACPGETSGWSAASDEVVYAFTPEVSGVYTIAFTTTWDSTVWVVTDCADVNGTCVAGADNGEPETVIVELVAGTTYYIMGGPYENIDPGAGGDYTLTISDVCLPVCDGTSCGSNGCGGTCDCNDGDWCDAGTCAPLPTEGDTCDAPILVDAAPYEDTGTTIPYENDYGYATGVCPGESGSGNNASDDVVYAFTPTVSATYVIEFDAGYDSTVYVVTDCADVNGTCVGGADNGNPETVVAALDAGTTYYIIGGPWPNGTPGTGGNYTLRISEPILPPTEGDTCGDAIVVPAAPYTDDGYTLLHANDYGYGTGVCPGETGAGNGASSDVVYEFTPTVTGFYTIQFVTTWNSTVYIVTDCADVNATCVAGADNGNPETIVAALDAGTTYYIIGGPYQNSLPAGAGGAYTLTISDPMQPPTEGDTCDAPILVDAAPYEDAGSTLLFENDYGYASGVCPGESGSGNNASDDVVYAFTPDVSATYVIEFDAPTYDSTVYVVTDCADVDGTCVGGADNGNPETVVAALDAGTTYYIIGGPWSNVSPGTGGDYTLRISEPLLPPTEGDTCDAPIVVDAVPYTDDGYTVQYTNNYGYASNVCPGESGGWNAGSDDVVYAFTPAVSGSYTIVFATTWDSTVYVVTDCANVNTTCVAGADNVQPETITTNLVAGTTYYIIGGPYSNTPPGGAGGAYSLSITMN